jgi:hypothetical protein
MAQLVGSSSSLQVTGVLLHDPEVTGLLLDLDRSKKKPLSTAMGLDNTR